MGAAAVVSSGWVYPTLVAAIVCVVAGCDSVQGSPTDARLDTVERQIAEAQRRLLAVKAEVAEAEARAEAARAEAEFQGCRAKVTQLRAEMERRRAQCAKDVADRNLCIAHNSQRTATSGIVGCGLGLAVAAVSGGTAAPWALGGCAAGAGAGVLSGNECPAATCVASLDDIDATVLHESGLDALPRCGGFVGVEVVEGRAIAAHGLPIEQLSPGTYADAANLAVGDVVTSVQGIGVASIQDIERVLSVVSDGQAVRVDVVRGGRLFQMSAPASRHIDRQRLADKPKLGVHLGPPVAHVEYRAGVLVSGLVPDSPAETTGLRVGDRLASVQAAGALTASDIDLSLGELEAMMGELRPATQVDFRLLRDGRVAVAHVRLEARKGRAAL
ncbi:MAG TPA: PDZ domain-containing protein [Polyangiaceae bacterium]|nr:PDZ domain-containing protein [Polyangiaceae bacterium]